MCILSAKYRWNITSYHISGKWHNASRLQLQFVHTIMYYSLHDVLHLNYEEYIIEVLYACVDRQSTSGICF